MAKKNNLPPPSWHQNNLFDLLDILDAVDSVVSSHGETVNSKEDTNAGSEQSRYKLALRLAAKLNHDGKITSKSLTQDADTIFGGTQAEGAYSIKEAYDAMEAAFNIHLLSTEKSGWTEQNPEWAKSKAIELNNRIQFLPTQTRRDQEMEEYQQFSTPPALAFVANWVANVKNTDVMLDPSAGTGDLAIWSKIAGARIILNELSERRHALLADLFPDASLFKENAEQLDNVLPVDTVPTVIIMNPPFSSTAGRVRGQRNTTNGARHIEQALKRLQEGGRLVAIVGNGMAYDKPVFREWWREIEKKYSVRANVGISGREYAKYGTTFNNQILVIDKTGATHQDILTSTVESVADLPLLLQRIRNERQPIQPEFIEPAVNEDTQALSDSIQPGEGAGSTGADKDGFTEEFTGNTGDRGTDQIAQPVVLKPAISDVIDDRIGAGGKFHDGAIGITGGSGGTDTGGNTGISESDSSNSELVEDKSSRIAEFTDSVFASYKPQRINIAGTKPHPGKLVQSAAMSAVEPPFPGYLPKLAKNVIHDGLLSIAQLEAIVYAGQAHSEQLPNGSRKGFFIGDGTGVGKGREISGIILDNMMQGRNKAVWVSFNEGLINDAKRDFSGIGGDPDKLFFQGKTKAGNEISSQDGILFTTYSTLRGGEKKQANELGQKAGKTRAQQIIDWLGQDFDGVIAFDEAHSMGNAIGIRGKRGIKKPSQQALAGINLQRELPNARVVYVSATGATEISNLSYADRLGLWGQGTPFADVNTFINEVSQGGIAAMELISRDMKAMGMYLARSLSYDGVTYERLEHTLSDFQEDIYNELAGAWQIVLNNVDEALKITQAGSSGTAKSAAMSQFWGTHQRFFNQIITAMQTPRVIDDIREHLEAGHVAVIQLVNTNEAAQERIIAEATANESALEDLDFTPRQMLTDYVRNSFPVAAYEETRDDNGNTVYVPVLDSDGNQVFDREAIALRDALLETLQQIRVPENPLDSIINAFGTDVVAEVTGRSRRFVQKRDDDGNLKVVEEKRGKHSSRADAEAFQNDKKKILIFSGAGGTGYSFHADNAAENKCKRIHYILQPGWRADAAVQGFGRTHRTNQANEPHYVLPTTNLKAQKRFVSSIARRLDQLGALTRGQRQATSQGMFTAADNLESQYAKVGLYNFFVDLYRGKTELSFQDITKQMGLNMLDENGSFSESKIPEIPQFLNRLLSLKTQQQNAVFGEFESRLIEAVEHAKQWGVYDKGLQTLTALSIKKTRDDVAYEDQKTGAQTRYIELDVTNALEYHSWTDIKKIANSRQKPGDLSGWFVSEQGKHKGDVFFLADCGERLNTEGNSVRRGVVYNIKKDGHQYVDNADIINRGWEYRVSIVNHVGTTEKVILNKAIDEAEAEKLWNQQLENAPKTETKTERMLVGIILPIWDRVEGSETIYRLQTDEGEQLLGRMMGAKSAKQTLKNLGLESDLAQKSSSELFNAIKNGSKAILSNGWEISLAKVNQEDRIEIKGRGYLSDAEKRVLNNQGAFIERIQWAERVFIPTGETGLDVFERITESKPVVDLIEKTREKQAKQGERIEQAYGVLQTNNYQTTASEHNSGNTKISNVININQGNNRKEVVSMDKKPFHVTVAENLIEQLKQGTAPWQKPWDAGAANQFVPNNPITGNRYKGINALHLMAQGYDDQRWLTYKQAQGVDAQVRKGEKGTGIQYWKFTEEQTKKDDNGKPVLDTDGDPVKVVVRLERPKVFFATVFNAEQIEGLPPIEHKEQTWNAIERAEQILQSSGADIRHGAGHAFYRSSSDSIHLPDKGLFPEADKYYATALHELGHWTGHESRLDRDLVHPFGSEGYAKEELRAEIASMILGDELGIGHDPGQHAAYVGSWIKALQDDPLEVFRAAADAEKIQEYVLGFEQKQVQEETMQQPDQEQTQEKVLITLPAHELTRDEFVKIATAVPLENHGRKWEVFAGEQTLGFSDADTPMGAIVEAHERAVNNALYSRSSQNENKVISVKTMPPEKVLQEYPELVEKFADTVGFNQQQSEQINTSLQGNNEAEKVFGFSLPDDWNGGIQFQGNVLQIGNSPDDKDRVIPAESLGVQPEFWSVYAQLTDGTVEWLADLPTQQQAYELADRLIEFDKENLNRYTSINKDINLSRDKVIENENAAKMAVVEEQRVINDPHSTREDIAAARELRETAEFAVIQSDIELQKNMTELEQQQTAAVTVTVTDKDLHDEKTYIDVPYKQKEEAKALGAQWDRQEKSWYIPPNVDRVPFAKWPTRAETETQEQPTVQSDNSKQISNQPEQQITTKDRQYLAVPYGERAVAKAAGAEWDKKAKSWYAGASANMDKLQRWLPENIKNQQSPAMTPKEEFAEALRSLGCIVDGAHPVMDGKKHRIGTEGDKKGEQAGFYIGHLDGHPAGYIKNNRTGLEMKWQSKGYSLDTEEKAKLQAEAAGKLQARAAEQEQQYEKTSQRVTQQLKGLEQVTEQTVYMKAKGIDPVPGVLTDSEKQKTFIPAFDVNGKQWTMQYIQEDGTKRFAKDSRKEGCFHAIGGLDALEKAPVLVIGEGFATAGSLSQTLGFSTVAAFDSGNLPHVAKALHEKYPDKPIIIAGDDDKHLEITQGINPGRSKAEAAAKLVGAKVLFPIFAPGEQAVNPKGFSDFNDLATKSSLGKERIERQVCSVVNKAIEQKQQHFIEQQKNEQKQDSVDKLEHKQRKTLKI